MEFLRWQSLVHSSVRMRRVRVVFLVLSVTFAAAAFALDDTAIIRMIQYGDPNSSLINEAISDWWESPHEPNSVFAVASALKESPTLSSKASSGLSAECAIADQAQCNTSVGALESRGLPMTSRDLSPYTDYVLLVVPGEIRRSKADESETQVTSTFVSDHRQAPNPRYFALQNQYQSAQLQVQSAQQQVVAASQMPPGFAAGYAQGLALRQMKDANELVRDVASELQSTSPTLTEDVRVPYTFTVVTTRALYQQRIGFVLVHRHSGSAWGARGIVEEQQVFKVARGINENDNTRGQYSTDEDATDRWLSQTRNLDVQTFRLLEWEPMEPSAFKGVQPASFAKVAARYFVGATPDRQTATATAHKVDRRFRSVVVVKSKVGMGAGFFISSHNLITNAHVVGAERSVTVRLYESQEEVPAEVVAADSRRDLALLRTAATGQAVSLLPVGGDVPVGSQLVVIGHPRGLEFSLTSGVVSAVRDERDEQGDVQVIQTDTALNPGNSGGPVFLGDQVVGVASFKRRSSEGLGFAVHTSELRKFLASAFLQ